MRAMEYLGQKMLLTYLLFHFACRMSGGRFREASHTRPSFVGWEIMATIEKKLGRSGLSVGTCIHMNYLLVVQQEMRNKNKLGKEKQKNKQMVSRPLLHFFFAFSFLPAEAVGRVLLRTNPHVFN